MKRSDFRYTERLRVRWVEVDMQKIVFNGHYLMYFDTAVAGYWRALALPYHETMAQFDGDLYVRKATLEYEGSARYDEVCQVGIRCGRIGNSSMVLHAALFRGEQRLVHGELVYVFADPASQTSKPVPQPLRDLLTAYEGGQPVVELSLGEWAPSAIDVGAWRKAWQAAEPEGAGLGDAADGAGPIDAPEAADTTALHALARNRLGQVVAGGRLQAEAPGIARIDRLAVTASLRGSGIGRVVLDGLLAAAERRGDREVRLSTPAGAATFWQRAGFVAAGPVVDASAGPRLAMVRRN